ncbi:MULTISPECIES: hypothetical protein [Dickeya]|uniref:hypothetical protein n=1 Tax=Dickeya TaxID=204037 RepID=UPI00144007B1|nr:MULTISPECIES: hypothetical protein [Dickeya]MCO7253478.1 hypothetical protein [Dickeya oryzae]QIZ48286.1 hypothetical protein DWV07_16150 [Dickeya zeae]UPT54895.1 hypothetical protein FGI00_04610 [Dickeya zeae]UUE09196.1 hypothetical protein NMX13_16300 [Dickeya zeae]WKV49893.1 hypothetical protein PL145_18555 [Dickeya fangzhongdai]
MLSPITSSAFAVMPVPASTSVETNTEQKVSDRNLQSLKAAETSGESTKKQQETTINGQQQSMQAQIVVMQGQIAQLQNQQVQQPQESKPLVRPVEGVNRPSAEHAIDIYI